MTNRISRKGNPIKEITNEYQLRTYEEALQIGAVLPALGRDVYYRTFASDEAKERMKEFRDVYPQPNDQYQWWPVIGAEIGQMKYLQSFDGKLMSRAFTRAHMSRMSDEQLQRKFPEEHHSWDWNVDSREPNPNENEFSQVVEYWAGVCAHAMLICCVMQLGYESGCSPAD